MPDNKLTFQEILEKKETEKGGFSYLGARILAIKQDAENSWLRSLGKNDFKHSKNLEKHLNRLVPDEIKKDEFDSAEIFVLLYAVYLHDIGRLKKIEGHEKESFDEIINNFQKYGLKNKYEATAVAHVCYGHASEQEYPLAKIKDNFGVDELGGKPLNLRFLAALFRLTDELDNAYTRVIGYQNQKKSIRHLVRFVNIDIDRWIICYQTEPTTEQQWKQLDDMRRFTQERLDEVVWVI